MCLAEHSMAECMWLCRGVATFPEGVPEPPGTLRMIWSARGVRVGISSISRTQCFWFTTLTCPEVRPPISWNPARILSPVWCSRKEAILRAIALSCHDSFKA